MERPPVKQRTRPKLAIFDMGGVMVDGHDVVPGMAADIGVEAQELRRMLGAAGAEDLSEGKGTAAEFWRRFEAQTGLRLPGEPWADYFHPRRRPAMYALVESLQAAGVRVVAGTNTLDPHYQAHLGAGDYDVFDHTYASNLMGVAKPAPEFWLRILAAEGVEPGEAVFVDDVPENVAGAASVGLHAVLFESQEQVRAAVEEAFGLAGLVAGHGRS